MQQTNCQQFQKLSLRDASNIGRKVEEVSMWWRNLVWKGLHSHTLHRFSLRPLRPCILIMDTKINITDTYSALLIKTLQCSLVIKHKHISLKKDSTQNFGPCGGLYRVNHLLQRIFDPESHERKTQCNTETQERSTNVSSHFTMILHQLLKGIPSNIQTHLIITQILWHFSEIHLPWFA